MLERIERLRTRMQEAQCDAFFSAAPPANQYLTEFRGTTSAVAVTLDDARFFCDSRYTEQAQAQVQGMAVEEVTGEQMKAVAAFFNKRRAKRAVFEPDYLLVSQLRRFEEELHGEACPEAGLVSSMRAVKSPEEIESIRKALELAEDVLSDTMELVEIGMTERELAARFEYAFQRKGASGASFPTIALFGARSSLPHGEPGSASLEWGDIVLVDFGCRLDGYCSDLTRTYAFGTIPGTWFEETYHLVLAAQRMAVEAVRPGMRCREFDAIARSLISEAGQGAHFGHGLGHGVGIEIHEQPRANRFSDTILEPGMVVTVEPGVYIPGRGGVRIEDVIAITEQGCSILSSAPRELRILGT